MEQTMQRLRILSKGQIKDLSSGFSLKGEPFSVFVRVKGMADMQTSTIAQCKLMCDKETGDFPLPIGDWTPAAIVEIAPNGVDLEKYDLFWGAGNIDNNK